MNCHSQQARLRDPGDSVSSNIRNYLIAGPSNLKQPTRHIANLLCSCRLDSKCIDSGFFSERLTRRFPRVERGGKPQGLGTHALTEPDDRINMSPRRVQFIDYAFSICFLELESCPHQNTLEPVKP